MNGKLVRTVGRTTLSTVLDRAYGPSTRIHIEAIGNDGTSSVRTLVRYKTSGWIKGSTISFKGNSAVLSSAAKTRLRALARSVKTQGFKQVRVEGHSAMLPGSKVWRMAVSKRRAAAVKKFLAAEFRRIKVTVRITTAAYGGARPVASNRTEAGRIRNRRAEVLVR